MFELIDVSLSGILKAVYCVSGVGAELLKRFGLLETGGCWDRLSKLCAIASVSDAPTL